MSIDLFEQYIQSGNLKGLDTLLKNSPQLAKTITSYHVSPIMLACYYKKPVVVDFLLPYLDELTLFEASAIGKLNVVTHLINAHSDSVNEFSDDGFTPLGLACYFGQADVAGFLVQQDADVNLPSKNGFHVYPIHSAVAANKIDIVRMLIENGAQVNVKQQSGVTPLHSAAQIGNLELLILLLENNADVSIRMEGGKLPADLAQEKGFNEIAEILGN